MPLGQSMSPAVHKWAFARQGFTGDYALWRVETRDLEHFVLRMRHIPLSGASVTIPHKTAIIPLLDGLTPEAEEAGAVNTLFWENSMLMGHNTDVQGFLAPLEPLLQGRSIASALVLGAGGAARACLAGLARLGAGEVLVAARSPEKAHALEKDFACRLVPWEARLDFLSAMGPDLIINATPLGMAGAHEGETPIPAEAWPEAGQEGPLRLAYDLVYNPPQTRFLREAGEHGWKAVDGVDFFVAQAVAQSLLWTGKGFPPDEGRTVVLEAMARLTAV